ncbi:FxsA family protein [Campylobacter concisus]|uniref:FxsA family protein n=1 Tax=Campylobacter concisus TaxID=199 RepID=UPI00122CCA2C|nr:FxsA family protein [Campylobacter concisus]
MRFFAFLFFIIEAALIYVFVNKFGFLNYFLEVLVSGFVGIALLLNAGFSSLNSPQVAFKSFLGGNLFSQLGLSLGGMLLFLPGILTDIFGIAVIVFSLVFKKNAAKNESYQEFKFQNFSEHGTKKDDGEIIDVEVIEEPKRVN